MSHPARHVPGSSRSRSPRPPGHGAARRPRHDAFRGPAVTYLVWPHGHPRLPALDFGREPIPHVDVVAGTDLHIDADEFLGW